MLLDLTLVVLGNDDEPPPVIIGGTFAVRGVKSPAIYESLCRAMRIAVCPLLLLYSLIPNSIRSMSIWLFISSSV